MGLPRELDATSSVLVINAPFSGVTDGVSKLRSRVLGEWPTRRNVAAGRSWPRVARAPMRQTPRWRGLLLTLTPTAPTAATSGADFAHAALGQVDLADTNLSHASFNHANLAGANLAKANLSGADLRFAIASVADLEAADMSHADLRLACFDHANLSASNLRGAVLRPRRSLRRQSCQSQSQRGEFALRDLGSGDARGCRSVGRRSQPCSTRSGRSQRRQFERCPPGLRRFLWRQSGECQSVRGAPALRQEYRARRSLGKAG